VFRPKVGTGFGAEGTQEELKCSAQKWVPVLGQKEHKGILKCSAQKWVLVLGQKEHKKNLKYSTQKWILVLGGKVHQNKTRAWLSVRKKKCSVNLKKLKRQNKKEKKGRTYEYS